MLEGTMNITANIAGPLPYTDAERVEHQSALDKDDFMRILLTQLANQDPTNPMEDRDFIAQMAQFSALEQMQNMNTQLLLLRESPVQLAHLIGKQVVWTGAGGKEMDGVVNAVLHKNGWTYAEVGEELVPMMDIIGLKGQKETTG